MAKRKHVSRTARLLSERAKKGWRTRRSIVERDGIVHWKPHGSYVQCECGAGYPLGSWGAAHVATTRITRVCDDEQRGCGAMIVIDERAAREAQDD